MEIQKNLFDLNYEELKAFLYKKIGIEKKKIEYENTADFQRCISKRLK